MNKDLKNLSINETRVDSGAIEFCERFMRSSSHRYVFGCNQWAKSIAEHINVDGFVDDFTSSEVFCGKPVIRVNAVPKKAMVVSAVVLGRPITAQIKLNDRGVCSLDYYAFKKYSGLPLKEVTFLGEFEDEFKLNSARFESIYDQLADLESRRIFSRLINFRLTRDLSYMEGFVDAQDRQYFESFLDLQRQGEVFVDVGSYDGYTSQEFIKRCPDYRAVHIFEPEPSNMTGVKERLRDYGNIHYHPYGASDKAQVLRFKSGGSSSSISDDGELTINVERIDDLVQEPFTFLKMDIEGGEVPALLGASSSIVAHHPRLAISVYHKADDLWRIPELVLTFRNDYELYLRHYTEGVDETVMFFLPKR